MDKDTLFAMRHSLAHIMAAAVKRLWPEVKLGVGPVVENGFYYDIDLGETKISDEDFPKIESTMRKIIAEHQDFVRSDKSIDEAIEWAGQSNQPYKTELLHDLKRAGTTVAKDLDVDELGLDASDGSKVESVSFYTNGDFTDLCRGPHLANTSEVGAFKLMRIAGAYWRGKENNPQMQRLYGVAFATKEELDKYLAMLEEAKKRDHRKLGQELDLFLFSPLVGSGLPLFTPRGTVLRDELTKFAESLRYASGFERVSIPHITKTDLYKVSGHWDKFGDELFLVKSQETSDEFAMKPMNCPHHNQIYASQPRSYRDLPIKYFETTTVYRDEKTGELGGLSRVRSISQDDSHAYCRDDQIGGVVAGLISDIRTIYSNVIGMPLKARLSFRDASDKYLGDLELWQRAQNIIREQAVENELDFFEAEGEAAFYGPKIDFMATDAIGREHQVATIQIDFVQPERFELEYTTEDGSAARPVMVHCALLGSIERFLSVFIEHTAGRFPVWCAPEQLRIIKVKDDPTIDAFAEQVLDLAKEYGVRATLDDSNNSVGKKIRNAEVWKVPYSVVVGEKEATSGQLPLRVRSDIAVEGRSETEFAPEQLVKSIANESRSRVAKSSL
ncbi:MAG TPA: threonine--tRNA ligase [Candidatus Nanoperiomorbaceae bacterium]|nr:threonine--tRNA ligase [Candidatus Nanoperiomorbaceae bacterium]HMQ96970.1 threonine--tRNA ligase [Candidatus Nanoperiomorbaceae bacterium]